MSTKKGGIVMAITLEQLDKMYEGKEEDDYYLQMQARLGTEAEKQAAYDENGEHHCIGWFDCRFCPAFDWNACV